MREAADPWESACSQEAPAAIRDFGTIAVAIQGGSLVQLGVTEKRRLAG
jgi:hypothetical protein